VYTEVLLCIAVQGLTASSLEVAFPLVSLDCTVRGKGKEDCGRDGGTH
jgi:hypothetical protein